MSEVLVIGHRNPDTDAICAAIGYAEYKRRTGMHEAVAARCGDINDRIDFVLHRFGVAPPRFVADVAPKARDLMTAHVLSVDPAAAAAEAMSVMDEHNLRVLPVLDAEGKCQGLVSLFKISKLLFPAATGQRDSRGVLCSLAGLARTLGGSILRADDPEKEQQLTLMVGAMGLESFAQRLELCPPEKLVVVVGDRWDIQNLAIREGVRAIIVTGNLPVEAKTAEAAERRRVSLISSPHDTMTTASLCRAAIAVRHVLDEDFLTFPEDAPIADIKLRATTSGFLTFPVVNAQGKVSGMLSKTDFLKKFQRKLILVDHNELSQAVMGADEVEILEIIDHHRIGSLTTPQPILFRNEPVGSTSTIVAESFFRDQVEMPGSIAGLLLAGVVSDTLNLTSPTSTARDARVLQRLEQISGVNARDFTDKLFASGSLLTHKSAGQAITTDLKVYYENGIRFSVAQIEEIGFDQFWKRKGELLTELENYRARHQYAFSALLVTDVVTQSSLLGIVGNRRLIEHIDFPRLEPGVYELVDVVSRKKQLLPYLTHSLHQVQLGASGGAAA